MITTIIFDLSEVYLKGLLGIEDELSKILDISENRVLNDLKNADLILFFEGKISEELYWDSVITNNNWKIEVKKLKSIVRNNFEEINGTREIIEDLKKMGFQLGLLSVHSREWIDFCENKFDFHRLFDSISYSFENALCKPNQLAYIEILNKLGSNPSECIFIDDSHDNILTAQQLGINTILFKTSEDLKVSLGKYLKYI